MPNTWPKERRLLGTRVPRLDGPEKATGRARYSLDVNRPGMLHARILRSPHAHAKVKSLDVSAARKMPGVKAIHVIIAPSASGTVVSADGDTVVVKTGVGNMAKERTLKVGPGLWLFRENKVVKPADLKADDRVVFQVEEEAVGRELFYAGDEVVAIACDTEEHAADAIRAIKVEYTELDGLVTEKDALANDLKTVPPFGNKNERNNVRLLREERSDDIDEAFKKADVVHEGEYGAHTINHQCLEPHGLVAEWTDDGGLTLWASTQAVAGIAFTAAAVFAIPAIKVKCITHYMGGGYGSKFAPEVEGMTAIELARKARAPVKLFLDRAEEVVLGGNRPSAFGKVKIGATKDGKLVAYYCDTWGTPGVSNGATVGPIPYVYEIPSKHTRISAVRLNTAVMRAMRAPGHPQSCLLTDCPLDDIAAKLGLDPMQVRLKNLPENDADAAKTQPQSYNAMRHTLYTDEIKIAAKLSDWDKRWHPPGRDNGPVKHGMGMALHTWGGAASFPNDIKVTISSDGSVLVESSTQDLGTGERTVLAIVVAEALGLEVKDITIHIGESPYGRSGGSGGSTTCPGTAPIAYMAALAARDELFAKIAERLKAKKEDLAIEVGGITDKAAKKKYAWKEACAKLGMDVVVGKPAANDAGMRQGLAELSNVKVGGVQVAEVLVDTETGVVRCTKVVAVQDCGLVVNKQGCESQVAGGVIMGVNYALFEERIMDRHTGRQVNADMEFYKLGGIKDMPQVVVHMHDMPERGVIGIGEPPTISTAAAVGNAVFNAIGVRVAHAPYTPERVLAALAKKA